MQQIPLPRVHVRVCARGGGFRPITSAFSSLLTAQFSVFVRVISISMRVSRGDTSTKAAIKSPTGEGITIFLPSSINLITIDALTLFALEN